MSERGRAVYPLTFLTITHQLWFPEPEAKTVKLRFRLVIYLKGLKFRPWKTNWTEWHYWLGEYQCRKENHCVRTHVCCLFSYIWCLKVIVHEVEEERMTKKLLSQDLELNQYQWNTLMVFSSHIVDRQLFHNTGDTNETSFWPGVSQSQHVSSHNRFSELKHWRTGLAVTSHPTPLTTKTKRMLP